MDIGTTVDYLKAKLTRSREDLEDSRYLFSQGKYRLSVNRAYYAIYHVVSATLASMGHARSKHSGIEAAFQQYLIKTKRLEPEHGVTYKLARKLRENADYEIDKTITEEIARDILERCEKLVNQIEAYLYKSNLLSEEEVNG